MTSKRETSMLHQWTRIISCTFKLYQCSFPVWVRPSAISWNMGLMTLKRCPSLHFWDIYFFFFKIQALRPQFQNRAGKNMNIKSISTNRLHDGGLCWQEFLRGARAKHQSPTCWFFPARVPTSAWIFKRNHGPILMFYGPMLCVRGFQTVALRAPAWKP